MVVLHAEIEFDKKIYETMRYKVFQNHYFGYGVVVAALIAQIKRRSPNLESSLN